MFDKEEVENLHKGDCVRLKKWMNKKDGSRRMTSDENVILAGKSREWFSFRNLTTYYKDTNINDYGVTWSLEPAINSYEGR